MVSVLSNVFRECQAKHKHVNDNDNRVQNRISSHLCVNKDACFLSLSSFLSNCSYDGSGKNRFRWIECEYIAYTRIPKRLLCYSPDHQLFCIWFYAGKFCQNPIGDCQPSCQHNGTCVSTPNGYVCNCTEGYTGELTNFDKRYQLISYQFNHVFILDFSISFIFFYEFLLCRNWKKSPLFLP